MTVIAAPTLQAALTEAIEDEYRARARYLKTIQAFGPVQPFTNILASEERHIQALQRLFATYSFPLPADTWYARTPFPVSLADACRSCGEAEVANILMYERLLGQVAQLADVRQVFLNLQAASRDSHLPAFRQCLFQLSGEEPSTAARVPTVVGGPAPMAEPGLETALLGAVIGGANAFGRDLHRVRRKEITMKQAIGGSLMRSATTSLATTSAGALTANLRERQFLRLAAFAVTTAGLSYLMSAIVRETIDR